MGCRPFYLLAVTLAFSASADLAVAQPLLQERRPLSIEAVTSLSFGRVSTQDGQSGTVTIDPRTGAKLVRGGVLDLGGDHAAAEFRVRGEPNQAVAVFLPGEVPMVDRGGARIGRLGAFTADPPGILTLDARGEAALRVGATWNVVPNIGRVEPQASYSVIVEYMD